MNLPAQAGTLVAKSSVHHKLARYEANGNSNPSKNPTGDIYYVGFYEGNLDNVYISNGTITLTPHTENDPSCGSYAPGLSYSYSGPLIARLPSPIPKECAINYSIIGDLVSNADTDVSIFPGLSGYYEDGKTQAPSASSGTYIDLSPANSCQITMDDSVDFCPLNNGTKSTKELALSTTAGNPQLLINGPDIQADGTLYLGGNDKVTVVPQNVSTGMGGWVSSAGSIPLTITIDKSATSGEYKSILTAVLTCQ